MKTFFRFLAICLVLSTICFSSAATMVVMEALAARHLKAPTQEGFTWEQMLAAGVTIDTPTKYGSGIEARYRGLPIILTAAHVIEDQDKKLQEPRVRHHQEGKEADWRTVRYLAHSSLDDLAVFLVLQPRAVASVDLIQALCLGKRGEDAWYCGTPAQLENAFGRTVVGLPSFEADGQKWMVVRGDHWFGSSGGPVWVKRGDGYKLAGLVSRFAGPTYARQAFSCTRADTIRRFLDAHLPAPE